MVNFGSRLSRCPKPAWTTDYICYDRLKELIAGFSAGTGKMESFDEQLAGSLAKVDETCSTRETYLKAAKEELALEFANIQSPAQSGQIKSKLAAFSEQVDELRHYINWNYMAVIKIVKKRNKNASAFSNTTPLDAEAILLKRHFYTSTFIAKVGTFTTLLCAKLSDTAPDASLFSCAICLDKLKNPVSLACNHRFCFECISKCVHPNEQAGMVVSCALCRRHHLFTPESFKVDTSLTNFLVNDLGFTGCNAPCLVKPEPKPQATTEKPVLEKAAEPAMLEPPTDDIFTELEAYFELDGFANSPDLKARSAKGTPVKKMAIPTPTTPPPAADHDIPDLQHLISNISSPILAESSLPATFYTDPLDEVFRLQKAMVPIASPQLNSLPPCNSLQMAMKPSGSVLDRIEELLKSPELPKPVEPTKTGRRRRIIPLKTLDAHLQAPQQKRQKLDTNSCEDEACRERNRHAAKMFRSRDQQYVQQLEVVVQQLEKRKEDLTRLEVSLKEHNSKRSMHSYVEEAMPARAISLDFCF